MTKEEIVSLAVFNGEQVYPYSCGSMTAAQWAAREIDQEEASKEEAEQWARESS